MVRRRLTPKERKQIILDAATRLSNELGLHNWTQQRVADECRVQTSLDTIKKYFGTTDNLRRAVLKHKDCSDMVRLQADAMGLRTP